MIRFARGILVAAGALLAALLPVPASAQTPFVPYFGKNQIRYDNFRWHTYTTDHFEIYYYPEMEAHLARVAGYAESAYQHVSSELKHDLPSRVPLVLFKTQAEFQQQNISGDELPEGVLAFAEPSRDRSPPPPAYTIGATTYNDVGSALAALASGGASSKYFHANSTLADSTATGLDSVAIGPVAQSLAAGGVSIGLNAVATNANDVALGSGSVTAAPNNAGPFTLNGGTAAATAPTSVVSVGAADRKSTRLNSSHIPLSRMPSSA